jgi:hypothetical protein
MGIMENLSYLWTQWMFWKILIEHLVTFNGLMGLKGHHEMSDGVSVTLKDSMDVL